MRTASRSWMRAADVGKTIRVSETATNAAGMGASSLSPATAVVYGTPTNTAAPRITGTPVAGRLLKVTPGSWRNAASFSYEWQRCAAGHCAAIPGADTATLRLGGGALDSKLKAVVTATNAAGSTSATSAPTGVVRPSTSELETQLKRAITPHGARGSIAEILQTGGYALSFGALEPGRGVVRWWLSGAGPRAARFNLTLVATAAVTFHVAGHATVMVRLTAAGAPAARLTHIGPTYRRSDIHCFGSEGDRGDRALHTQVRCRRTREERPPSQDYTLPLYERVGGSRTRRHDRRIDLGRASPANPKLLCQGVAFIPALRSRPHSPGRRRTD